MYSFDYDYGEIGHPQILKNLEKYSLEQNIGYGLDKHSFKAKETIKKHLDHENCDIHFTMAGTQSNAIAISFMLRPYEAVISASTGHININEAGAIESVGHKVLSVGHEDGKLRPHMILEILKEHRSEHNVKPKLVYISNTTELGTVYTKSEIEALYEICKKHDLYFFLDGARLGSAITSEHNDMKISDYCKYFDMFYIGGTKNGALLGEAMVIVNDKFKKDFRYIIKNKGALYAKGFICGIEFQTLFEDDLYFKLAKHSNEMSSLLAQGIKESGYEFLAPAQSNMLFPIIDNTMVEKLRKNFSFSIMDRFENKSLLRLVCSWATPQSAVDEFISCIKSNI